MNKFKFNIDIMTNYVMDGKEVLTFNKEEMRGVITLTIKAIEKAEVKGAVKGLVVGVGCCYAARLYYAKRDGQKKTRVESK